MRDQESMIFESYLWPKVEGEYRGSANAEGYMVDGGALNLSEKDQKWLGIKDTFKF